VDDVLDYEAGEATLGKPGGADLQLGLATGPALAAWEEHPEMGPLIGRKFDQPGDVERVCVHCIAGLVYILIRYFRLESLSADHRECSEPETLHKRMQTKPEKSCALSQIAMPNSHWMLLRRRS
jgi:geranylgeranyl pyrophosphate synthase